MYDLRENILGPPHGTLPTAVIGNENKTDSLRAVNILKRKGMGHAIVSAT